MKNKKHQYKIGDLVKWDNDGKILYGIVTKIGVLIENKVYHSYVDIIWHDDLGMRFFDKSDYRDFEKIKIIARA